MGNKILAVFRRKSTAFRSFMQIERARTARAEHEDEQAGYVPMGKRTGNRSEQAKHAPEQDEAMERSASGNE